MVSPVDEGIAGVDVEARGRLGPSPRSCSTVSLSTSFAFPFPLSFSPFLFVD